MHKRTEERGFLTHSAGETLGVATKCFGHAEMLSKIARSVPRFIVGYTVHSSVVANVFPCGQSGIEASVLWNDTQALARSFNVRTVIQDYPSVRWAVDP